jgi:hypothetical protein
MKVKKKGRTCAFKFNSHSNPQPTSMKLLLHEADGPEPRLQAITEDFRNMCKFLPRQIVWQSPI